LKFVRPRNDDADIERSQLEQQAEVIQVAIVEGILVIPLDFETDAVLETIDLVCW
jgi:hypothetical protein